MAGHTHTQCKHTKAILALTVTKHFLWLKHAGFIWEYTANLSKFVSWRTCEVVLRFLSPSVVGAYTTHIFTKHQHHTVTQERSSPLISRVFVYTVCWGKNLKLTEHIPQQGTQRRLRFVIGNTLLRVSRGQTTHIHISTLNCLKMTGPVFCCTYMIPDVSSPVQTQRTLSFYSR